MKTFLYTLHKGEISGVTVSQPDDQYLYISVYQCQSNAKLSFQDMSFFDDETNAAGRLASKLAADIPSIEGVRKPN